MATKRIEPIFSWNGYYYGKRELKRGSKFYKSKTVRFDETFGGVQEVTEEEYFGFAKKYYDIFR